MEWETDWVDGYPPPIIAAVKQRYGSAFRGAEPACTKPLYRVHDDTGVLLLNSRVAHIHARRNNGSRWIETDPDGEAV